jgi:hypothetical protein
MVIIRPDAIEALNEAIREFQEFRPDPVVVFWLHDPRSEDVTDEGMSLRRFHLGQPHSAIFPSKSAKSVPDCERLEVGGLRVIVMPRHYKDRHITVGIIAGELIADA